jgi:hypothetical protein
MFFTSIKSRTSALKLAALGAIAAASCFAAPAALAATSGGVAVAPATSASTAAATSSPFTIGISSRTVKPGAKVTISGLAYARAGENLTITSNAIASGRFVGGVPAVQTPALVEGIYHTTVRIAPATEPGTYAVVLRYGNSQVASLTNLRVVAATSHAASGTSNNGCDRIAFSVLHNDRVGAARLPAGRYTLSSRNMDCGTASADFTSFLARGGKSISGWNTASTGAGRATFTARNTGLTFSVAKAS